MRLFIEMFKDNNLYVFSLVLAFETVDTLQHTHIHFKTRTGPLLSYPNRIPEWKMEPI